MALSPGTRFGAFEITDRIGAGGMGEVYRARDTELGRDVAIKVLPASLAGDAARIARFEHEAKTLAALNHPNVAHIHGLERSGETTALVMELIDGPTLAERIAEGPLPADEALAVAMQVAAALEAAHARGIVHRDLKPANVKLRPDGLVKVLDFGIAKALAPEPLAGSGGSSPIMTTPVTQAGVILGTAAYMSPEQARGKPVDQRADIWAFGCLLYEMLTGQLAFGGEDVAVTLARVIANDTELDSLPAAVSPAVRHTIGLCLEKDPARRIADVRDVRLALEGRFESRAAGPVAESRSPGRPALALAAIGAAAVLAGVAGWSLKPDPPPAPRPIARFVHALPDEFAVASASRRAVAISPDGARFLYITTSGIHIRALSAFETTLIPWNGQPGWAAVFSPDGESVAYEQLGQLRRIPVAGGASFALAQASTLGNSWQADGTILIAEDQGIVQVPENGGQPELLVPIENGFFHSAQRLPAGDWLLFTVANITTQGQVVFSDAEIVVESPSSGERRVLRSGASSARYVPSGHLVYAYEGVLYAVPFDADRLEETGSPVPVVEGVADTVTGISQFDVSDSGTLIYVPGPVGAGSLDFRLVVADRGNVQTIVNAPERAYGIVRASPDGSRLAIDSDDGAEAIVWIHELAGGSAMRRLTFDGRNAVPVWSPDGARIAFQSDRGGDKAVWVTRVDGSGGAERLTEAADGEAHVPESWSPDGRHLSFSIEKDGRFELWVLSLADGEIARFGNVTSLEPIGSTFSPDGNWLAYHALPRDGTQLTTASGVFVEPFPATGARYQAPKIERDFQPVWSRDGLRLHYIGSTASGRLVSVDISTASGLTFGEPELTPFALTGNRLSGGLRGFDVLPGERFVGLVSGAVRDGAGTDELRIVVNWLDELARLVPTGRSD